MPFQQYYMDALVQDYSISIHNALRYCILALNHLETKGHFDVNIDLLRR